MKFFVGIILLLCLFLYPLFINPFYANHDAEGHIARFAAYYQAFQDGQMPPRWAGNLNFGYGTSIFIFYYPLPGYIASLMHVFGLNFELIFKLLIGISFAAAPLTFYLWAKLFVKKETALLGGFIYGFAPYHFLNLYVRADVAELMAFVFIPLVFWAIEKTLKTKKLLFVFLGGIFYGLVILSHNGVSLMFSPVFMLYGLVKSRNKEFLLRFSIMIIIGLSISAFFWISAIYEGQYTNSRLFIGNMYKDHFPSVLQFIDPRWGFGPDVRKSGGLSPQIGLLHIGFVISAIFLWFKEKKRKILGTWIFIFFISIFFILPLSDPVWRNIEILRLYEFPWRFLGLTSFSTAVIACFVLEKVKNKQLLIILFIVFMCISLLMVKTKAQPAKDDAFYNSFTGTTDYHGAASSIWTAGNPWKFAKKQVELIGGQGIISKVDKKTQIHTFSVKAENTLSILDNTLYFPGWQVFVDDQKVPIQFQDQNHRGLITFEVPKGNHNIVVVFKESKIRKISDVISITSLLSIFFAGFYLKSINRFIKRHIKK